MRVLLASLLVARVAHADSDDLVGRPLVLARGELEAQLVLETSLQPAFVGKPTSLAPDAWFGVTPSLTVGVVHSNRSVDQIDTADGFCLRSNLADCDATYQGSGIDARYAVRTGSVAIAPRVRLLLRDVDPAKPATTIGALARYTRGRFAVTTDPYLRLGLANRDRGNRAALVLPVWLAVQPTCRWLVALHTGWDGELAVARDGWHVPVAIVVAARPTASLEVGFELGFPSLLGPQNQTQARVLHVVVGWRHRVVD